MLESLAEVDSCVAETAPQLVSEDVGRLEVDILSVVSCFEGLAWFVGFVRN